MKKVKTDYLSETATVIFDDSKTNEDALIEASTSKGFRRRKKLSNLYIVTKIKENSRANKGNT